MSEEQAAPLVQNTESGTSIDMNAIPPSTEPQFNEAQQAFTKYFGENESFKDLASLENPFEGLTEKLSSQPATGLTLPGENATPEEVAAFHKAIGAGENLEAYTYEAPTSDDEAIKALLPTDEPFLKAFQEVAHKAGMPLKAWNEIKTAYNQMIVESVKTSMESGKLAEKKFGEQFNQKFGSDAPKVLAAFQKRYADVAPAEKAILDSLSESQMMVLAARAHEFEKQYIKEDSLLDGAKPSSSMSQAEFLNKLSDLYSKKNRIEAEKGGFNPEVDAVVLEIDRLKKEFAVMQKA